VKVAVFVWPWWDVGEGIAVQGIVDDFGNRSLEVVGVAGRAAGSVGDRRFQEGNLRFPEEVHRCVKAIHRSAGALGAYRVYASWSRDR